MWRILVLPREHLAAQWRAAFNELSPLLADLQAKLDPATFSLVAWGRDDGDFLLFDSVYQGQLQEITLKLLEHNPRAYGLWQQRQKAFLQALAEYLKPMPQSESAPAVPQKYSFLAKKTRPPQAQYVPNAALLVKIVLEHPQHLYLINGEQPIVLPLMAQDYYQALKQRHPDLLAVTASAVAPAVAVSTANTANTAPAAAGAVAVTATTAVTAAGATTPALAAPAPVALMGSEPSSITTPSQSPTSSPATDAAPWVPVSRYAINHDSPADSNSAPAPAHANAHAADISEATTNVAASSLDANTPASDSAIAAETAAHATNSSLGATSPNTNTNTNSATATANGAIGGDATGGVGAGATAAAPAANAQTAEPSRRARPLLWLLLALGLGAILLSVGYYWGAWTEQKHAQEIMDLEHEIAATQLALTENKALQDKVAARLEQIAAERRAAELARQQRYQEELAQTQKEQQELIKGLRENLRLQNMVKKRLQEAHDLAAAKKQAEEYEQLMRERAAKEAAEAAKAAAAAELAKKQADEAAKKAAAEAAKKQAAAKAEAEKKAKDKAKDKAKESKDKATVANSANSSKKLPRCSVIVKEGKVPQLVVVMDGSGSMLNRLSDGKMRIDAAQEAAQALVKRIDSSVPIRLYGIQGCPFARDYGVFNKGERSRLAATIKRINPKYEPVPWSVQTSLINALRGMAASVATGNDAVGVLISDGKDTCAGTRHINICQEARRIHSQKPKLKIHVVLLGKEAQQAKCVADITGGQTFRPQNAGDLVSALRAAGRTLEKVCE